MSIVMVEKVGSRSMSRSQGSFTASRTFLVYDDAGDFLSIDDAINFEDGIRLGDEHPNNSNIFANGFDISASNERQSTWEVNWSYAKPESIEDFGHPDNPDPDPETNTDPDPDDPDDEFEPPTGGEDEPDGGSGSDDGTDDEGVSETGGGGSGGGGGFGGGDTIRPFTGINVTTGITLADGYYAGSTPPSGGSETGTAIADGTAVHESGEPVTITIPTMDISFSETVFTSAFYFNGIHEKASKRNSGSFWGFPTGSIVFKGMSVQRKEASVYDITYNFAWDKFLHMRQAPERDTDGKVVVAGDGSVDVFWKQPLPDTTSFDFSP